VTEQLNEDLRRLAERRGSTMSDVVVEILEKGLRDAAKAEGRRAKA
jgi:predicted DNA-binding protein